MYDIAAWWHGKWSDDQLSRLAYLRDVYSLPQTSSENDSAGTTGAESPLAGAHGLTGDGSIAR